MSLLNYHHLHYFWAVAREGNLTRAAARLHVSQSAISTQIKQLEDMLGQALFIRRGRALVLTESGQVALSYAETIFATGDELVGLLRDGRRSTRQVLRVGSVATLSRNFQESFLRPIVQSGGADLIVQSGGMNELLAKLAVHTLDVVLSNRQEHGDTTRPFRCRRIARQPISLVGKPRRGHRRFRFPEDLLETALLLPGRDSDVRASFDVLCDQLGLRPRLMAEVDDMAMLRLLARQADGLALLPRVVVRDELKSKRLVEYCVVPGLYENFFAITVPRRFTPPLLRTLLNRSEEDVL
jgi:LysR family transcriptional activator of nhaA